MFIFIDFV